MSSPQDLANRAVLVMGDVMLDEYVWGDVQRISPEAPVPVVEFRLRTYVVGGAGNAAANVASLSGHALLGGVVGPDIEADILREELTKSHIDAHLVTDGDRSTTTKTRIIGGSQQMLRIDRGERKQVAHETESALLEWAKGRLPTIDCVLVSDYGKGVVTDGLCKGLMDLRENSQESRRCGSEGTGLLQVHGSHGRDSQRHGSSGWPSSPSATLLATWRPM